MAHRALKRGDYIRWGDYPGQVAARRRTRPGEIYVLMPSIENATGGHWLREEELDLSHELSEADLDLLIKQLCTVDGQEAGTSPPWPGSRVGELLTKLQRMREALK